LFPPNAEAAWMLQLIQLKLDQTSLPQDIKDNFLIDMVPYVNNASMTNISRGQVKEMLGGFNELWLKIKIYKYPKKFVKELSYVMTYIRELLVQNLNKSIGGWQGDHVFERKSKTTYSIHQSQEDGSERMRRWFDMRGRRKRGSSGEEAMLE